MKNKIKLTGIAMTQAQRKWRLVRREGCFLQGFYNEQR